MRTVLGIIIALLILNIVATILLGRWSLREEIRRWSQRRRRLRWATRVRQDPPRTTWTSRDVVPSHGELADVVSEKYPLNYYRSTTSGHLVMARYFANAGQLGELKLTETEQRNGALLGLHDLEVPADHYAYWDNEKNFAHVMPAEEFRRNYSRCPVGRIAGGNFKSNASRRSFKRIDPSQEDIESFDKSIKSAVDSGDDHP